MESNSPDNSSFTPTFCTVSLLLNSCLSAEAILGADANESASHVRNLTASNEWSTGTAWPWLWMRMTGSPKNTGSSICSDLVNIESTAPTKCTDGIVSADEVTVGRRLAGRRLHGCACRQDSIPVSETH
eukprot:3762728-Prymnesium_polylepis.2